MEPGTEPNGEQTASDPQSNSTESHSTQPSSELHAPSLSARLGFGNSLRQILCPKSASDLTALYNFQKWLEIEGRHAYEDVLAMAQESRTGRNPIAVFFSRCEKELGYRPRAIADKRK